MFRVMKNPRIYERLVTEIRTAHPPNSNEIPTYAQTNRLPYLQACIKEALRVLPAIGRPLPRIVPPEGKTLAGETFPSGVIVGIPAWTVHRDKKVWGEDADVFRPERWLEGDASKYERYFIPVDRRPDFMWTDGVVFNWAASMYWAEHCVDGVGVAYRRPPFPVRPNSGGSETGTLAIAVH
jgi:Cytochrome P450